MKTTTRRTEILIQKKKKSLYVIGIGFILLLFLCCRMIYKELCFLEVAGELDRFFNAEFPPVLNAILLMLLLLSNTFFVFWGFLAVKYDEKECCMDLRKLTFDEKKIVQHQYEWAGIMLSIFLLVSCIACVVLRIMINAKLGSKFEIEISGDLIGRFVLKIVCIVIMAAISLTIGRIIAYLFRNIVIGVILCLVLDQVIVAKSWLMSGFVYRIYNDIDCFISVGACTWQQMPVGLVIAISLVTCLVLYGFMILVTQKRGR